MDPQVAPCDCPRFSSLGPTPEDFIALIGGFPEKISLDVRVLDERTCNGYVRRLIEYTASGEMCVPAFLMVPQEVSWPTGAAKLPGVVAVHQDGNRTHRNFGKSEVVGLVGDADQAYGTELCLRGHVVLCPDRPGFEARQGKPALGGARGELFELHRAVDVLCELPQVDAARIGVIGHSAGGMLAARLMFTDPRVRAGAVSCGALLGRWSAIPKDQLPPGYNIPKPSIPGFLEWGDHDAVLAGIAPRPYFERRADSLGPAFDEELTRKARERYAALGVPERFQYVASHEFVHSFPPDQRELCYAWLERWLEL